MRRGPGGVLEPANLRSERLEEITDLLIEWLADQTKPVSRRDLTKGKAGQDVSKFIKSSFDGYAQNRDLEPAIGYALDRGWMVEREVRAGKTGQAKAVLEVVQRGS